MAADENRGVDAQELRRRRASWAVFAAALLAAATLAVTLPPARSGGATRGAPADVPFAQGGPLRSTLTPAYARPDSAWFTPDSCTPGDCRYVTGPELPLYHLELPPDTRAGLAQLNAELLARQTPVMTEEDRIWFPAVFHEGEHRFAVEVRLRGDLAAHWGGEIKSWRVRFPKHDLFHGVHILNFIVLSDRAYVAEALAFHLARCAGALAFRDGFCRLAVDAGPPQAYYLAEAPTAEFLEAAGRPVSAIFRSRDLPFEYLTYRGKLEEQAGEPLGPEFFKNYVSVPEREGAHIAALEAMFKCRTHTELTQLLDGRKHAVVEAITMVFGARHCLGSHNLYYYFDESVGLFEPILWDVSVFPLSADLPRGLERGPRGVLRHLEGILVADAHHRHLRNRILWDWVADDGRAVLAAYDHLHACLGPWLDPSRRERDEQRIAAARAVLAGNLSALARELAFTRVFVHSALANPGGPGAVHSLHVRNGSFAPVAVEEILIDGRLAPESPDLLLSWDRNRNGMLDERDPVVGRAEPLPHVQRLRVHLDPTVRVYNLMNDSLVTVPDEEGLFLHGGTFAARPGKVHFALRNCVTGEELSRDDIWDATAEAGAVAGLLLKARGRSGFLSDQSAFTADPADTTCVRLGSGIHTIAEDIIVPRGLHVTIDPGAELHLGPGVSLVSYSPITAVGEPATPIVLRSADPQTAWGVVAVVGPLDEISTFRHVTWSGQGEGSWGGAVFTGGLSVHGCPVLIEHCRFERGRGEDAVNLKNSRGEIRACVFSDNPSDAVDLDWSSVDVIGCRFENNAGDALDVSGSHAHLLHSIIRNSGDKGVSIGERSRMLVCDCRVEGCSLGVAVKDLSQAEIVSTTLSSNDVAVACYQKKMLFGGGTATLDYCVLRDNGLAHACDPHSTCHLRQCRGQVGPLDYDGRRRLAEALSAAPLPERELPVGYIGLAEAAR